MLHNYIYDIQHNNRNIFVISAVAVGEQGKALPQASLFKGRFGGIVNILLLIMIMAHNHD